LWLCPRWGLAATARLALGELGSELARLSDFNIENTDDRENAIGQVRIGADKHLGITDETRGAENDFVGVVARDYEDDSLIAGFPGESFNRSLDTLRVEEPNVNIDFLDI